MPEPKISDGRNRCSIGECSTCGGSGRLACMAHVAGDGCDEMVLDCPDCLPGSSGVAVKP